MAIRVTDRWRHAPRGTPEQALLSTVKLYAADGGRSAAKAPCKRLPRHDAAQAFDDCPVMLRKRAEVLAKMIHGYQALKVIGIHALFVFACVVQMGVRRLGTVHTLPRMYMRQHTVVVNRKVPIPISTDSCAGPIPASGLSVDDVALAERAAKLVPLNVRVARLDWFATTTLAVADGDFWGRLRVHLGVSPTKTFRGAVPRAVTAAPRLSLAQLYRNYGVFGRLEVRCDVLT